MRSIEDEADRRASQAMTAAGWGTFPVNLAEGKPMEKSYWEDYAEAYEEALEDLEAENEKH
jgi:hypothetical protein